MRRNLSCPEDVERLNRGAWTAQEDKSLTSYIMVHGEGKWSHVPFRAGLNRSGKSCRLRWLNYLRPDIKRGNITQDEEDLIMRLHKLLGNRWSLIAGRLPGRTDNEIKNYWNTTLGKKLRTESGAGPSSRQKKQHTSSKSSDSDDVITTRLPHVIQTKALRCKNVFIQQHPPHCHEETSTINSPASDHLGFELAPQFLQDLEQKEEFKDELNAADFYREFNFDDSIMDDMVMDAQANEFSLIGNCETADDGCGNIGTMDLDLMTFLLDSSSGSGDGLNSF